MSTSSGQKRAVSIRAECWFSSLGRSDNGLRPTKFGEGINYEHRIFVKA